MRGPSRLTTWVLLAYGALGALGASLSVAFGGSAVTREPWLAVSGFEAIAASLVLGASGGALAIIASRFLFQKARWARALRQAAPAREQGGRRRHLAHGAREQHGRRAFFPGFPVGHGRRLALVAR